MPTASQGPAPPPPYASLSAPHTLPVPTFDGVPPPPVAAAEEEGAADDDDDDDEATDWAEPGRGNDSCCASNAPSGCCPRSSACTPRARTIHAGSSSAPSASAFPAERIAPRTRRQS